MNKNGGSTKTYSTKKKQFYYKSKYKSMNKSKKDFFFKDFGGWQPYHMLHSEVFFNVIMLAFNSFFDFIFLLVIFYFLF